MLKGHGSRPVWRAIHGGFALFNSEEEPKGLDCTDHLNTMQNCFKEHWDVRGAELDPDAELPEGEEIPGEQPALAAPRAGAWNES